MAELNALAASLPIFYTGQIDLYIDQIDFLMVHEFAPAGVVTQYDQFHLALYAALLDAHAAGIDWREAAESLMRLDPDDEGAERCWKSHLDRARWIIGEGLAQACNAFGSDFGSFNRANDR